MTDAAAAQSDVGEVPPAGLNRETAFKAVAHGQVEARRECLRAAQLMRIECGSAAADERAGRAGDRPIDVDESAACDFLRADQIPLFHVEEFDRGVEAAAFVARMAERPHERSRNDVFLCHRQGRHDKNDRCQSNLKSRVRITRISFTTAAAVAPRTDHSSKTSPEVRSKDSRRLARLVQTSPHLGRTPPRPGSMADLLEKRVRAYNRWFGDVKGEIA